MAIKITDECINCGACEPECPNNAIYEGGAEWRFSDGTSVKGMFTKLDGSSVDADAPQAPKSMDTYYIVSDKCTECVGYFDEPQCVQVCPVACIPVNPERVEGRDALLAKFRLLQQTAK